MTRCLRVVAFSVVVLAANCAFAEDWQLTGEKDGITIYHRAVPGSAIVALKGAGAIEAPV